MDWSAIGALGEILGAVAVVGSLLFVARQVRANTSAVRSAAYGSILSSQSAVLQSFATDERMVGLFKRVMWDRALSGDFTDEERICLGLAFLSLLSQWQNAYFQAIREQVVDDDVVAGMVNSTLTNSPYFGEFWQRNRHELPSAFVTFLEGRHAGLAQTSAEEARSSGGAKVGLHSGTT